MKELKHGEKMYLLNPENYKGYACHPAEDKTIRKVLRAFIERDTHLNHWFSLEIEFEEEHIFHSSSATVKGCKQIFAVQCSAGSKWEIE